MINHNSLLSFNKDRRIRRSKRLPKHEPLASMLIWGSSQESIDPLLIELVPFLEILFFQFISSAWVGSTSCFPYFLLRLLDSVWHAFFLTPLMPILDPSNTVIKMGNYFEITHVNLSTNSTVTLLSLLLLSLSNILFFLSDFFLAWSKYRWNSYHNVATG